MVVATSPAAAGRLLGTDLPHVDSGRAVLLDLGVRSDRRDAFVVSDLDGAGWLERYSLPDPSLAPAGESLVQAQLPLRDGEGKVEGLARLEALADQALPGWRDRPAVARGDGVFLAGDMVAAPGLLSEVSFHSAVAAAQGALRLAVHTGSR